MPTHINEAFTVMKWGIYVHEMRHLYIWNEAFMYIKWGNSYISVCPYKHICTGRISYLLNAYMHKMRYLCIWNEAFVYVKWGMYTNEMSVHVCEMRHVYKWNETFTYIKRGISYVSSSRAVGRTAVGVSSSRTGGSSSVDVVSVSSILQWPAVAAVVYVCSECEVWWV